MNDNVGRESNDAGTLVRGRFAVGGMPFAGLLCQFAQGLCLRAYAPDDVPLKPAYGRSSEYPAKAKPWLSKDPPRFAVVNGSPEGRLSSTTPWLEPENS